MKIDNVEVMILKSEQKENKERIPYVAISVAIIDDGGVFDMISKDVTLAKLQPFSKHVVNFELSNGKYGMKLSLVDIVQ